MLDCKRKVTGIGRLIIFKIASTRDARRENLSVL